MVKFPRTVSELNKSGYQTDLYDAAGTDVYYLFEPILCMTVVNARRVINWTNSTRFDFWFDSRTKRYKTGLRRRQLVPYYK